MLRCVCRNESIKRIYRNQIRCVLKFENELYLIVKDSYNNNVICKGKWSCYRGFRCVGKNVPENVFNYASKLVELNYEDSERYPLMGEWYSIKTYLHMDTVRWNLRKIKNRQTTALMATVSSLLKFVVAMFFAWLVFATTKHYTNEWLYSIFPFFERTTIETINAVIEYAGCITILLVFKNNKNILELLFNAFIPAGLIVIAGVLRCYWWMWIVVAVTLCLTWLLSRTLGELCGERKGRRSECIRRTLIFTCTLMFMVTVFGGCEAYYRSGKVSNEIEMSMTEAQNQLEIECGKLEKNAWVTLTSQEKIDLLQMICDFECKYVLGCTPVKVYAGLTSREGVWGAYCDQTRSFVICAEHLLNGDVEDVVGTALHEIRHAYQQRLVEMYFSLENQLGDEYKNLYPFNQARSFSEEFAEYCSGEEDFYKYYTQDIEKDSREWAEKRVKEYYMFFIYPNQ